MTPADDHLLAAGAPAAAAIRARYLALPTRRMLVLAACFACALAAILANLALGPVVVPLASVLRILTGTHEAVGADGGVAASVVLDLRAPRVVQGLLVGAALAVSGAAFQGLFRNPLADPSLVGISAGAATGAVGYIVLGSALGSAFAPLAAIPRMAALPLAAIGGALAAAAALYRLGRRGSDLDIATLLLAGIAINALCLSASGLLIFVSDDEQLRELNFWSLGSLARAHWPVLLPALPWLLGATAWLVARAGVLNALALGEAEAWHLGYRVERVKLEVVALTATAVGTAVAIAGVIGFIGLIVPHLLRLAIGADNRYVLAGAAALGGALLLVADLLARTLVVPAELPIGILTSLLGGPFFLWLMQRQRCAPALP
ncbi:MAG: iron ABC transporter permease [Gammaproteobacteria bacterium]